MAAIGTSTTRPKQQEQRQGAWPQACLSAPDNGYGDVYAEGASDYEFDGLVESFVLGLRRRDVAMTHVTIASVTIFLHRHQAHRGAHAASRREPLLPLLALADHRHGHARVGCHSPQAPCAAAKRQRIRTARRSMASGACCSAASGLYRTEASRRETLETYGRGTPDDWLERNVYGRYRFRGLGITLRHRRRCCSAGSASRSSPCRWSGFRSGPPASSTASATTGVIETSRPQDTSRNIVPIGILIGGEEFHNNHHAYGSFGEAREQVVGARHRLGLHPRCSRCCGLASVKKVAPRASFSRATSTIDSIRARGRREPLLRAQALRPPRHRARAARRTPTASSSFPRRQLARVRKLMIRERRPGCVRIRTCGSGSRARSAAQSDAAHRLSVHAAAEGAVGPVHARRRRSFEAPAGLVCRSGSERNSSARRFRATTTSLHRPARLTHVGPRRSRPPSCVGAASRRCAHRRLAAGCRGHWSGYRPVGLNSSRHVARRAGRDCQLTSAHRRVNPLPSASTARRPWPAIARPTERRTNDRVPRPQAAPHRGSTCQRQWPAGRSGRIARRGRSRGVAFGRSG